MRNILLVLASATIAQMVEIVYVWRSSCKPQQRFIRNKSLLVALLWCSACAGAQPAMPMATRVERVAAQHAREAKLIEFAKRHPNAFPRERTVCPEKAPPGATLNCPYRANSGKPWL